MSQFNVEGERARVKDAGLLNYPAVCEDPLPYTQVKLRNSAYNILEGWYLHVPWGIVGEF